MTSWGKTPRLLIAACVLALGLCLVLILAQRWPAPPEKVRLNTASGQKDALMPGQGAAQGLQGIVPLITPMQGERIPINHASKEELMTLPGIDDIALHDPHDGQILKAHRLIDQIIALAAVPIPGAAAAAATGGHRQHQYHCQGQSCKSFQLSHVLNLLVRSLYLARGQRNSAAMLSV